MEPYRIKHKGTGLYYKPGNSNLSKTGKVYLTSRNILNYLEVVDYLYITSNKETIIKSLEDLGYEIKKSVCSSSKLCFRVPKSEFEIKYMTNKPDSAIWS